MPELYFGWWKSAVLVYGVFFLIFGPWLLAELICWIWSKFDD